MQNPRDAPPSTSSNAYWGYTTFRPLQREAMEAVARRPRLAGRAADRRRQVAVLPGAGAGARRPRRRRLAADLADEGPGRQRCVGNGVPAACYNSALSRRGRRADVTRGVRDGALPAAVRGARAPGRRRRRRVPAGCSRPAASASSRSTRRTASASGGTTSGPSTGSSAQLRERCPASSLHAYTATATGARAPATSSRSSACATPRELVGSFDRPEPRLPGAARDRRSSAQILDVLARHRGEAGIIYCISRKEVDSAGGSGSRGHGLAARCRTTPA